MTGIVSLFAVSFPAKRQERPSDKTGTLPANQMYLAGNTNENTFRYVSCFEIHNPSKSVFIFVSLQ